AAQVNILTLNDDDNPADAKGKVDILDNSANTYPDLDPHLVYGHITGLGMGKDVTIGPDLQPGGITFANMQEVNINLGNVQKNASTINTNTGVVDPKLGLLAYTGKLALDTGASKGTVNLISLGGHTSVTSHGGSSDIYLDDQVAHTLQRDQGLLTIATDVPQAVVEDLADGSPKGISFGVGTLGTTQIQILATGGTFGLSFNGGAAPPRPLASHIPRG